MVTFRNNNNNIRRNNFRRNDRNFKTIGDRPKFSSNYSNNESFVEEKFTKVNEASQNEVSKDEVVKKTEVVTEVKKPVKSQTKAI